MFWLFQDEAMRSEYFWTWQVPEEKLWDASKEENMGLDAESVWLVREKALQLVREKLNIRIDDFGFELLPWWLQ